MTWKPASDSPPIAEDVLIYSTVHKGYAVAYMNTERAWINSTNGMPFPPHTVTHWQPLPEPPTEYRSLRAVDDNH